MSKLDHTPLPWVVDTNKDFVGVYTEDATGSIIAQLAPFQFAVRPKAEVLANARMIARAVNHHEDLLEALKWAVALEPQDDSCARWVSNARAVIAKVESAS